VLILQYVLRMQVKLSEEDGVEEAEGGGGGIQNTPPPLPLSPPTHDVLKDSTPGYPHTHTQRERERDREREMAMMITSKL